MLYTSPAPSETSALRAVSRKAGCALLAVCVLQLAAAPLALLRPHLPPMGDALWFSLIVLLSSLTVLGGALVGVRLLGFRRQAEPRAPLFPDSPLLVVAGAALCMAGNFAALLVERLAGRFGVEFHGGPAQVVPQGAPGLLLALLTTALLPAVTEELLLRGTILPALRPFGDAFAVVCTAALFALLHQNMQQAPMAFVSSLALGWVSVRGGRLLLPILVHLWNNAAAAVLLLFPERAANVYMLLLFAVGALSLMYLFLHRPQREKPMCALPPGHRAANFFFGSLAMPLSLAYFVVVIVLNTKFS